MAQSFELTKEGVKISYLRFLSDSAAGYVFLLLFVVAFLLKLPMPLVGQSWLTIVPTNPGVEFKVFIFVMSFIIATPLGLAINGAGWFLLGTVPVWLLRFWICAPRGFDFLIAGTRRSYFAKETGQFFGWRTAPDGCALGFYEQANYYEMLFSIYFPECFEQLEAVNGLRRFARNLSLLALIISIYSLLVLRKLYVAGLFAAMFLMLVLFNSLLEYYQCLKVLFTAYVLTSKLHGQDITQDQIVQNLIDQSPLIRRDSE